MLFGILYGCHRLRAACKAYQTDGTIPDLEVHRDQNPDLEPVNGVNSYVLMHFDEVRVR